MADAFLRLDTLAELKRFIVDTYGVRHDELAWYWTEFKVVCRVSAF